MAVLEKIRKRTFFLILTIGLALFAFIISGLFDRGFGQPPTTLGSVNGDEIDYFTFQSQVEATSKNMGGNPNISTMYIVDALWQQAVQNKILDQQFEKLGISIGKDQIFAALAQSAIGQDPRFQNTTGAFDPNKFAQFIADLQKTQPQSFQQWQMQEAQLIEAAKRDTYLTLIQAGLGSTASEGEIAYHQEADKVDIKYVTLQYNTIADSLIKISDDQIKDYINKNKKEFEQKASRNIQFVFVKEEASQSDKDEIMNSLKAVNQPVVRYNATTQQNDTIAGFGAIAKEDVADFVNKNSDIPFDSLYVSKDRLPSLVADRLYNLSAGEVYGPYEDANYYKLTRMLEKTANAEVKASHILIAYQGSLQGNDAITRTKEEAKIKAENVLAQVRKGTDFAQLARENSDDASNANNGGDLNFFKRGVMVKPFDDYVFSNKIGDIGMVETNFGFHIIKITDQKEGVKLATIARTIEPSEKTRTDIFQKVADFELKAAANPAKFTELAQKEGFSVLPADNLQEMSDDIFGLGSNRPIVKWAFGDDTKVGQVSRFDVKDGYAVTQLTKKGKEGLASVADARPIVEPILIKQEKAKQLIQKIKGNTIDEIANTIGQENIRLGENINIKSPILLGVGMEPKVIGTAFGLALNKLSKPIEGENGVYVIEVTKKEIAPALSNYKTYTNTLNTLKMNRASQDLFSALQETAEIEDNRSTFY